VTNGPRAVVLAAAIALIAPASAGAKGASAAKRRGAAECRRVNDDRVALALAGGSGAR
jgi:hypothetical protein